MNAPGVVQSRVRARYAETNAEGVVYCANYSVYEIVHGDDRRLIAKGRTVQVFDLDAMRPIRLPPEIRDVLCAAPAPFSQ